MDIENEKVNVPADAGNENENNGTERRYRPEEDKAKNALVKAETLGAQTDGGKTIKNKKKNAIVKLIIALAAVGAAIAIIIPVYKNVLKDILFPKSDPETVELIDDGNGESGEVYYMGNSVAMMQTLGYYDASRIVIRNRAEEWSLTLLEDKETSEKHYAVTGHTFAPFSTADFAALLAEFRLGGTLKRIETDCRDFSVFGLDEASEPISYTMELPSGAAHTVYIGKAVPTGEGYYAKYVYKSASGAITERKAVYIVASSMYELADNTMLDFLMPTLTIPLFQKDYIPARFAIFHGEDVFVDIRALSAEEIKESETAKIMHVYTSDGCEYDAGTEYTSMLYDVVMPGISGKRVAAVGSDEASLDEEDLAAFGISLSSPAYVFYLNAKVPDESGNGKETVQNIIFSEKTEDETYFAYVMEFDTIVEIDASAIEFLSWDVAEFAEDGIYLQELTKVRHITYDSTKMADKYAAQGIVKVKEGFTITSYDTVAADKTPIQKVKSVVMDSSGKDVADTIDKNGDKVSGIDNFKWLYASLMAVDVQFDLPEKDISKLDLERDADVTVTIETVSGKTHTMEFYFYDTRHAFYVLDGKGRFYLIIDDVAKVLDAITDVQNGIAVDYFSKN